MISINYPSLLQKNFEILKLIKIFHPQDTSRYLNHHLWRLVSLDYLKRLQPVLRATSRAGKCSNQVEGVFQWSQWGFQLGSVACFSKRFQMIRHDSRWGFNMVALVLLEKIFVNKDESWMVCFFWQLQDALELWNSTGRIWFDERSWGGSWLIIIDALT